MKKQSVLNIKGEKVKDISLNEAVWGIVPNDTVLYDAITLTRNAQRQGTAATKTRSEVSGGGRKPWRQKGTGRARQGSTRAPHWVGGGTVFGPQPRDYDKKMKNKELVVVDNFEVETTKTKDMKNILNIFEASTTVTLIVVSELTDNVILATRNLGNVILLAADEINTYDVISADKMIITESAVKQIEEVLA